MTKKIVVFVFIFCSVFSFAQESKVIDSLKREILKDKENKFEDYLKLTLIYTNNRDIKNLDILSKETLDYSLKKNDKKNIIKSYGLRSNYFLMTKDLETAQKYLNQGFDLIDKNDYFNYALLNKFQAKYYFSIQDFKKSYDYTKVAINNFKKCRPNKEIADQINNLKISLINDLIALSEFKEAKLKILELKKQKGLSTLEKKNIIIKEASLLGQLKDYKKAIKVYNELIKMPYNENEPKEIAQIAVANLQISAYYLELNNIILSKKYLEIGEDLKNKTEVLNKIAEPFILDLKAKILLKENEFAKAEKIADSAYNFSISNKDKYSKAGILNTKGIIKQKLNEKNDLIAESVKLFKSIDSKNGQLDALEDLVRYSINIKDSASGIKNFDDYIKLNNDVFNKELAKSISLYETKYRTAEKEAKIKEQQLQLEKEKANRNMALAGIAGLVLLSGGGFWFYRTKQKQKQLQTQNTLLGLQQNLNAMQLDNLNKQLDPHEIKNILANISPEIQRNAPEAYNKMTKLLNLTKASLSSNSVTDSIENQLHQIEDYLSLEKTVLPVPLQYSIHNTVDTTKQIPRLLLKNLVENSIKHGIKNKKEGGEIKVNISEKESTIFIEIDDTGIGRQQAISLDSGIGTSTYINLFETLNKTNTQKASFNIIDKENGIKVEIYIPTDYKYS
ncbi:histidine kinase [Flavobacterium croceum]|uniref:histidine kinase n=1 Tax=Flavobacterium croceum TaxID=370975 RepID=UPI0024A7ADB0|nr:histidine kinase [Flavobacterium croceum]